MYNLLRKSIIILIAGLGLLFFHGCSTVEPNLLLEQIPQISIEEIFPKEREILLFIDTNENFSLINNVLSQVFEDQDIRDYLESSEKVFIATSRDVQNGFDIIIEGDFPKWKIDFGLFFSKDWKKSKKQGYKTWKNSTGIELYIDSSGRVIVSTYDISKILEKIKLNKLKRPTESIVLIIPELSSELLKELSNGFIKDGVDRLTVTLEKEDFEYLLEAKLGLGSENKAKSFSRLLNIFFKIAAGYSSPEMLNIIENLTITPKSSTIILENIVLTEKDIIDLLYNLIFKVEEADK